LYWFACFMRLFSWGTIPRKIKSEDAPRVPAYILNKAAFGELTLGEVWELVKDEVDSVVVEESGFAWNPLTSVCLDGSSLNFSNESKTFDFSFDTSSGVRVMEDRVELVYQEEYGEKELMGIRFLRGGEPVSLKFLLYSSGH